MSKVLVTGAGRGLGLELTRQLLAKGDHVFATVRDPDRAGNLKDLAKEGAGQLEIHTLDVGDPESVEAMREAVSAQTESLDLLINNAGINAKALPEEQRNVRFGTLEPIGLERMIRINAIGPMLVTQALKTLLAHGNGAKVVSISSWLGSIAGKKRGGNYGYCASKTTLNMLARAMAHDLRNSGIISVVVNPGWVATDMGGSKADLSPEQSVAGILKVVAGLTEAAIGSFLSWDGAEHPW